MKFVLMVLAAFAALPYAIGGFVTTIVFVLIVMDRL